MSRTIATGLRAGGAAAVAAFVTLSSAAAQPAQSGNAPSHASAESAAESAPQSPIARGLFRDPRAVNATRYATPDGAVRFVFDRSGGRVALVRFEGDPEVHVLRPIAAAGGDEIYRTEDGDVALRLTRNGSITVYTRQNRMGAPAAEVAQVQPLEPEAVARAQFEARLREIQMRIQRMLGGPVTVQAPAPADAQSAGVVLDAAERAAQGLADAPLTVVRRVVITIGPAPQAQLAGESLTIQVAPAMGFAGRPSSNTIRNVATGQRPGPTQ